MRELRAFLPRKQCLLARELLFRNNSGVSVSWPVSFVFLRSGGTPDKASLASSSPQNAAAYTSPFLLKSGVSCTVSFVFLRSGGTPDKASRNNSGESGGAVGPRPAAATSCVRVDFLSLTPISPKQEIQQTPADSLGTLRPSEVTAVPKCRRPTLLLVKDGVSFPFQQWASVLALGQE